MPCRNCDCPFNENRAEIRQSSADQPRCLVADAAQKVSFEQGDIVFMQGQKSSSLYSLTEGMIKICSHTADGREQIVGLSTPGNMLVGLQSLNDERYAYTGIAATAVQACKIRHKTLLALIKEHGEIAMRLIIALNAQLAHSRALMEVMGHKCAAAKIASFILLMSLLGLSEETVCRLMANMKRAGAIYAPRGNIEIRNWDRLHAIADDTADGIRVA
jgi:CRP/FNR family transcriptional regulator